MLELEYEQVSNQAFTMALQKLARAPLKVKAAYAVSKMIDAMNDARQKITEDYSSSLLLTYAVKDEEGKVAYKNGEYEIIDGKAAEFEEAVKAFGKKKIAIQRDQLLLAWIAEAPGLSAVDVNALMPILNENTGGQIPFAM